MIVNVKMVSVTNVVFSAGVAFCAEGKKAEMAGKPFPTVSSCVGGVGLTWATLNVTRAHTCTHTHAHALSSKSFSKQITLQQLGVLQKKCHCVPDLERIFSSQLSQRSYNTYAVGATLTYSLYYHRFFSNYLIALLFHTMYYNKGVYSCIQYMCMRYYFGHIM